MRFTPHRLLVPILFHFLLITPTRAQIGTAYQDITTAPAFINLKPCAQDCFVDTGFCPNDVLASKIGCKEHTRCADSNWQATNDCYCRSDLQRAAQDYLTSCVKRSCTVGDVNIDGSSAGGIYSDYCKGKGYTSVAGPASASASATRGGGATATTGGGGSSGPAETGTSSSSGSDPPAEGSKKMSTSTIIGIAVGSAAGLALLVTIIRYMLRCCGGVGSPTYSMHNSQAPPPQPYYHQQQQQPSYPVNMYPEQSYWQHKPMGVESEVGPDDSVSVVTPPGMAPTLVSNTMR